MKFNPQHQKRMMHLLFIIIGVALSIFWLLKTFEQNIEFYRTPKTLINQSHVTDATIYVGGFVKPSALKLDNKHVTFILQTKQSGLPNAEIQVHFQGILPDLFKPGEFAIAIGKWKHTYLDAVKILAKHDEKYRPAFTH